MSDKQPVTVLSTIANIGTQAVGALGPTFLALIMINMIYMGIFYWYVGARAEHANEIIQQLLTSCLRGGHSDASPSPHNG